jgi:hypothetical protein
VSSASLDRGSLRRFGLWIGGGVALALAGWGAVAVATYGVQRLRPPPPALDVQVSNILHDAAKSGMRVSESTQADLHGSGEISRVFIFQSTNGTAQELAIYDRSGGRLRRELDFVPVTDNGNGPNPALTLKLVGAEDVDGNGRDELVLQLEGNYPEATTEAPLLAEWNPLSDAYEVVPMLTPHKARFGESTRPTVKPVRTNVILPPGLVPGPELYDEPIRIRNKTTGGTFRTYATDSFVLSKGAFSNALVASFIVGVNPKGPINDLNAWSISDSGPPPLLYACTTIDSNAAFIRFQPKANALTGDEALDREWASARPEFSC